MVRPPLRSPFRYGRGSDYDNARGNAEIIRAQRAFVMRRVDLAGATEIARQSGRATDRTNRQSICTAGVRDMSGQSRRKKDHDEVADRALTMLNRSRTRFE